MSAQQKLQVLRVVETSSLPAREALSRLDVALSTYYRWRRVFRERGAMGLPPEYPVGLIVLNLRQPSLTLCGRYWTPFRPVRKPRMSILKAIPLLDPASTGGQLVQCSDPCGQSSPGRQ